MTENSLANSFNKTTIFKDYKTEIFKTSKRRFEKMEKHHIVFLNKMIQHHNVKSH